MSALPPRSSWPPSRPPTRRERYYNPSINFAYRVVPDEPSEGDALATLKARLAAFEAEMRAELAALGGPQGGEP